MPAGRPKSVANNKVCKECNIRKSINEFHQHRLICKECRKNKDHDYYVQVRKK